MNIDLPGGGGRGGRWACELERVEWSVASCGRYCFIWMLRRAEDPFRCLSRHRRFESRRIGLRFERPAFWCCVDRWACLVFAQFEIITSVPTGFFLVLD